MKKVFLSITAFAMLSAVNTALANAGKATEDTAVVTEAYARLHYAEEYTNEPSDTVKEAMNLMDLDDDGLLFEVDQSGNLSITSAMEGNQDMETALYEEGEETEAITELLAPAEGAEKPVEE